MEVAPYNISVTLSLPPDTDTPGFAIEELSKPLETKLISETSSLVSPEAVAKGLFKDALVKRNQNCTLTQLMINNWQDKIFFRLENFSPLLVWKDSC